MRYFSSGIVPVGINKCMNENAPKIDKPKSIQEIIADLTEEDLTAISQLNLIRLLVKGMQSDDVNLKAQDQLVGDFMQAPSKATINLLEGFGMHTTCGAMQERT